MKFIDQLLPVVIIGIIHIFGFWFIRGSKLKKGGVMQVVNIALGAEGNFEIDFASGNLVLKVGENTPGLQGAVQINVPVTYFVDALVKKLGGSPAEVAVGALIDSVLKGIA